MQRITTPGGQWSQDYDISKISSSVSYISYFSFPLRSIESKRLSTRHTLASLLAQKISCKEIVSIIVWFEEPHLSLW